ncbi:helix-turn-helix transcriptional regulator [Parasphaerochaeta coccoides]|uniref:Helix-turn-helix domain protein n=1 Tax=Parasphaerochaeta coccoides (strain ATCC BAA-1237 / DSM 17374 / SPN1) TaxID=760011 RepID=F4GHU3_PARC1|nr:helix-turn-helix transcriptional regulator [Parasphaerochaeta coccoides]AEC02056.1 helix-turn-helix domain protein [Parasphaerochaeta coccoides DSM 17374]
MKRTKSYIHTYTVLILGEKGLSQTELARRIGCTPPALNQILLRKTVARDLQEKIARALNFTSWEELENKAEWFSELFSSMYNRPTSAKTWEAVS